MNFIYGFRNRWSFFITSITALDIIHDDNKKGEKHEIIQIQNKSKTVNANLDTIIRFFPTFSANFQKFENV